MSNFSSMTTPSKISDDLVTQKILLFNCLENIVLVPQLNFKSNYLYLLPNIYCHLLVQLNNST